MLNGGNKGKSIIALIVIMIFSVRCIDEESGPEFQQDPCSNLARKLECYLTYPEDEAALNPKNVVVKWTTDPSAEVVVGIGEAADELRDISVNNIMQYYPSGLVPGTTYFWRVISVTPCRSVQTETRSFTVVADTNLPFVSTMAAIVHENAPPRLGGEVRFRGSSAVTERGVFISQQPGPEITGTAYTMGSGEGFFSDLISQLTPATRYFFRAYARNSSGTAYGDEISAVLTAKDTYASVSDIDGNKYYITRIGGQEWLSENLRTTKFNDGTPIPEITGFESWSTATIPAYSWYGNNRGYSTTYGALYNGYTVNPALNGGKNVCPAGWHVPDEKELAGLIEYAGGSVRSTIVLRENSDAFWKCFSSQSSNTTGFSALPAGMRYGNVIRPEMPPQFYFIRNNTNFWSSTSEAHYLEIYCHGAVVYKGEKPTSGLSVRCIRDK